MSEMKEDAEAIQQEQELTEDIAEYFSFIENDDLHQVTECLQSATIHLETENLVGALHLADIRSSFILSLNSF